MQCCLFVDLADAVNKARLTHSVWDCVLRKRWLVGCIHPFEQNVTAGQWEGKGEQAHGQNGTQRGAVLISPQTARSSLVRQLRRKAELNLKVILVGHRVHLHLNAFDLPGSAASAASSAGLAVITPSYKYLFCLLLILVLPMRDKSVSFTADKLQTTPASRTSRLRFLRAGTRITNTTVLVSRRPNQPLNRMVLGRPWVGERLTWLDILQSELVRNLSWIIQFRLIYALLSFLCLLISPYAEPWLDLTIQQKVQSLSKTLKQFI